MAVNKVVYGGTTLIDLTGVSVSADKLMSGETALDKTGALIVGTMQSGGATGIKQGTFSVSSDISSTTNTKITDTAEIGFTPTKFFIYRVERSSTRYHMCQAAYIAMGSNYIRTLSYMSSATAVTSTGNTTNWTSQTNGYLYFASNTVYYRSNSSYRLGAGNYVWIAVQ